MSQAQRRLTVERWDVRVENMRVPDFHASATTIARALAVGVVAFATLFPYDHPVQAADLDYGYDTPRYETGRDFAPAALPFFGRPFPSAYVSARRPCVVERLVPTYDGLFYRGLVVQRVVVCGPHPGVRP